MQVHMYHSMHVCVAMCACGWVLIRQLNYSYNIHEEGDPGLALVWTSLDVVDAPVGGVLLVDLSDNFFSV